MSREYTVLHLFSGMGGAALGFQQARQEYRGLVGQFRTLAGIDVDPEACRDFEMLTGARAVELDLFTRQDYAAFHGHEPPAEWTEAAASDILAATGGEYPDVVFLSPPCKGFSGLLPAAKSQSEKYQALNRLVTRGLGLVMQVFGDDPPAVIMLENVPRIATRGEQLLRELKALLGRHNYAFHEGYHDCGEIGGLAQHRRRYLLIARQKGKVPTFIYRPPIRRVRAIGEVLGPLPMPDDPAGGPMHRLPRLKWRTWVRLALIPAGGDWRDLEALASNGWYHGAYRIVPWEDPCGTVTSGDGPSCHAPSVADPRLGHTPRKGVFRVVRWDKAAGAVLGTMRVNGSNGTAAVADPRLPVTGTRYTNKYAVIPWDDPATCVTGIPDVQAGAQSVADPRLGCSPRNGSYKVQAWEDPSATVTGAGDIHAGSSAVADPRIPADNEQPEPPVIVALDGTWHRPLTTWELAALQGFPVTMADGRPLTLAGNSDARWRERIGNAVPPPAAKAIAEQILLALMVSRAGDFALGTTGIWVRELGDGVSMVCRG